MSARPDAEKILSGKKKLQLGRALALVRMLEQEAAAGDLESSATKVRLVNHLIRDVETGVVVSLVETPSMVLEIRTGERGVPCVIAVEELETDTLLVLERRYGVRVRMDDVGVVGLTVAPVDAVARKACKDLDATACLARANEALGAYDFEMAVGALRLAVVRSNGAARMVEALAVFLVDQYAYYDEAVALLQSAKLTPLTNIVLQRCLADALFHTRQWDQARVHYRQLVIKKGEQLPIWMLRLSQACLEAGDPAEALNWAQKCQQFSEVERPARDVVERAKRQMEVGAAALLRQAQQAVTEGRLDDARTTAEQLSKAGQGGGDVSALLRTIRELDNQKRKRELTIRAREWLEQGQTSQALAVFRQILELAPDDSDVQDQVRRLEALELERQVREALVIAEEMESERRISGAMQELYRVAQSSQGHTLLRSLSEGRSTLVTVLVNYLDSAPKNPERSLESLIRLRDAEVAFRAGDVERAVMLAEEAVRGLRGYTVAEQLLENCRAARNQRTSSLAETAYTAGVDADHRNDFAEALARYDEVVRLMGESYRDVAERRHRIKREMDFDARMQDLTEKVEQRLSAGQLFVAQQLIRQTSPDLVEARPVADLETRVRLAIKDTYPLFGLVRTAPPALPGAAQVFDSSCFGLKDVAARDVRVLLDERSGHLVLLTQHSLILLNGDDLTVLGALKLPVSLGGNVQNEAVFTMPTLDGGMKIFIFHTINRTAWVLRVKHGEAFVETRLDLSRAIAPMPPEGSGVRSAAVAADCNTLVLLDFNQSGGRRDSRLVVIGLDDGRALASEGFAQGHMNLIPLRGTPNLLAARCFDPVFRQHKSWYHALIIDGRGKALERWNIDGIEEDIYAFRQAFVSPVTDRTYLEYWYLDPLSGRVANDGGAFMVLGKDKRLFYQASTPGMLVGAGRSISGVMHVVPGKDERDYLLWVWRDESKTAGVAVVDGKDIRTIGHVVYGDDVYIGAIRTDLSRRRAFCAIFSADNQRFRIEPFHYSSAK